MENKMENKLHWRFILYLSKKNENIGFTLIELVIVFLFLGILTAIAIPNFIKQVGKSREVEMKNTVGSINRAQQSYHWEKGQFADTGTDLVTLSSLNLTFDNKYIDSYDFNATGSVATVSPINNEFDDDGTRAYSGSLFYNSGVYNSTMCGGKSVVSAIAPPINVGDCQGNEVIR
jgi:type II secretory pathway pseudopilin PulG